jgi:hypothetical protein
MVDGMAGWMDTKCGQLCMAFRTKKITIQFGFLNLNRPEFHPSDLQH